MIIRACPHLLPPLSPPLPLTSALSSSFAKWAFWNLFIKWFSVILKNGKASCTMRDGVLCCKKSNLKSNSSSLTACKYSVLPHNVNVKHGFSWMNIQLSKEQNRLDVSTVEAMLQCNGNRDYNWKNFFFWKKFYKQILQSK